MSARPPENTEGQASDSTLYVAPRRLAERWDCSRTTAQRIADRAGITKVYLGEGRNGTVRYRLDEIQAYEEARRATSGVH